MAEMFGAPIGIMESDENIRRSALSGLKAQQLLGEIGMQPTELELKRAQVENTQALSSLHRADAATKEEALQSTRLYNEALRRARDEEAQQAAAQAAVRAEGRELTVADRPTGGFAQGAALTASERLFRMGASLEKYGAPLDKVLPLYEKGANIALHAAQTETAKANEELHKLDSARKRAQQLGAMADYALRGPQEYAEARAAAAADPTMSQHVGKLPQDWASAAPILRGLKAQAMTVKEKADVAARELEAKAAMARAGAASSQAATAAKVADARIELIRKRKDILDKYEGEGSASAAERRKELTAASVAKREALDRKEFPIMPLDPKAIQLGQQYTTANGKKVRAVADPTGSVQNAAGQRFSLIEVTPSRRPLAAGTSPDLLDEAMKDEE